MINDNQTDHVFYISSLDDLKDKEIGEDDIIFVKDNVYLFIYLTNNYDKYNLKNEFKIYFLSSSKKSIVQTLKVFNATLVKKDDKLF